MATGRTLERFARFYSDGYDLSGAARKLGDLKWEYATQPDAAWTDAVKNIIGVGQASLGVGTLNTFLDNTAVIGPHAVVAGAGVKRVVLVAIGIRAAPAQGDPAYAGEFEQQDYKAQKDGTNITASILFGDVDAVAAAINYDSPWGALLHAKSAEIAPNTAAGVDGGAQTTFGAFMCYHLLSSNGSVTLKVQHADTNVDGSFGDLSGMTSGSINASVTPAAGIVALARTATVKQFTRWQLAFGTANTATFVLSFHRAIH